MATYESLAQQALNQLLQRQYQEQAMQKNITGASSVPFLDAFSAGFNAGNGIVNAWRTREDNKRLRDFQKKQDDFNPENGNGNVTQQQQQLAQAQQFAYNNPEKLGFSNVFSMGQNPYNTVGGDIVNYNGRYFNSLQNQDNNPFGVSANDEGQRIAEQGSISPDLSNYNTSLQQVWGAGQTEPQQVQTQVQPQTQQQLSDYEARMNALPTAQNLDGRYSLSNYLNYARQNGMGNTQAMLNYYAFAMPFEQEARKARLEENFKIYNDPNATDEMKSRALAGMSYDLQNPDLVYDINQKREKDALARRRVELEERQLMAQQGYMLNPEYDENVSDSIGNSIVSTALNNYKEGEQWMSPDGTGDSRTQCANWVSDVVAKAGVKGLRSANGDELMKQAGNAYRTGISGIQPGDILNFKDHVGFYIGNGQYMARNSSGGVHRGSMEEAVQYFGQPLGYISMSQYTGNRRGQKYISNPNYVSPRERFEQQREDNAWNRAFRVNQLAQQRELAEDRLAARYGKGNRKGKQGNIIQTEDGTELALPKLKDMKNEEIYKTIQEYSDKDLDDLTEDKTQVYKVGDAFAKQFQSYLIKYNGNEGQAIRQMAYDLQADNKKGYSMNLDKLGLAVGSAYVSALGVKDDPARGINTNEVIYNVANYVKKFIEENDNKGKNNTTEENNAPVNPNSKEAKFEKHSKTVNSMNLNETRNRQKNNDPFASLSKYEKEDPFAALAKYEKK